MRFDLHLLRPADVPVPEVCNNDKQAVHNLASRAQKLPGSRGPLILFHARSSLAEYLTFQTPLH